MISLGAGSDVGYGGVCGALSPPEKDCGLLVAFTAASLRHEGDPPATTSRPTATTASSGGKGEDALFGGAGNDNLVGGSGSDLLSGGPGGDVLVGGPGRNRYYGESATTRSTPRTACASWWTAASGATS